MSVAIVIPENWEATKLVHWSSTIARAKNEDLLIIRPQRQAVTRKRKRSAGSPHADCAPLLEAIGEHAADFSLVELDVDDAHTPVVPADRRADDARRIVYLLHLDHDHLLAGVLKLIKSLRVRALIVPRHRGVRFASEEFAVERQLILEAPCETLQLRPGSADVDECDSILVASSGSKRGSPALSIGAELGASQEADVTALYVDPNAAPDTAPAAAPEGRRIVERFVRTSLRENREIVTPDVIVDADVPRGLRSYANTKGHRLIVVGGGRPSAAERTPRESVPEQLLVDSDEQTVLVVRKAITRWDQYWKLSERITRSFVPQLDREGRVELVKRLYSSAEWDFDLIFLICLATMLAALGLALNSGPVVIGAMLVAPLMTPMLGVGLSVVQGNRSLAKRCLITIRRGFLAAFATGCAVGIMRALFTGAITEEMANRGAPGMLDLAVAFVSGMVAAYAFGRPHLLPIVPGIAIATSLVPPVATAGLSVCSCRFDLAIGATMLFVSNFVAIVLGSATSLWFVGMRGPHEARAAADWTRRSMLGLSAATVFLTMYFSTVNAHWQTDSPQPSDVRQPQRLAAGVVPVQVDALAQPVPERDAETTAYDATNKQLIDLELEHVEIVIHPRAPESRQPPTADVTLIVPNRPRPVELHGIVARRWRPGWVTLELPPRERWERLMRWLSWRQQEGLESPEFFRFLEERIAQRFEPQLSTPM